MLVADGDAMVRGKMGSFLWAPQAEIEVMSLRSGLSSMTRLSLGGQFSYWRSWSVKSKGKGCVSSVMVDRGSCLPEVEKE